MEELEIKPDIRQTFEQIDAALRDKKLFAVKSLLNELPEQDISDYLEEQDDDELKATLFRLLHKDLAVDVFEHLEFEEQEILLNNLKHERVVEILEEMEPDDRTVLFEEMPAGVVKKYISHLSPEERQVATKLLGYPDDSVGRRMSTDYVACRPNVSVGEAIERVKNSDLDKETIYHIYIIDGKRKLIGYCSLKMLLFEERDRMLGEIMDEDVISLWTRKDQETAAQLFKHYDLLALPVVDSEGRLVGVVTFDDLVDVIEEEATEDIQKMAGIVPEEHPYFDTPLFSMAWKRIIWLAILLVGQLFSSLIVKGYKEALEATVALTMFIPMLLATGGNTGSQSAAMVIRGLAVGEIKLKKFLDVVLREMSTGVILGLGLCLLGFAGSYLLETDLRLSMVIGLSITLAVSLASVIGACLPLLFKKLGLDPALMSGPLISTLSDVLGLLVYFQMYRLFAQY